MAEPRLHIRNNASGHLLHANNDWKADTISNEHAGERDVKFKVQWCEKIGKFATTVMIRTDCHPQSLLDASDLAYQGGALDSKKCHDKNRWWKLHYLQVLETQVTVMFESYTKGKYLAETVDGIGVELIQIDANLPLDEVTGRAKWDLSIGGRALTPGQAAGVGWGVAPFTAVGGSISGIVSMGGLITALVAAGIGELSRLWSRATTLGEFVGTTYALAIGGTIGAIKGATAAV